MPQRRPTTVQLDLFAAELRDIAFRDQRDLMERPFVSLSKRPRMQPIEYQSGDVWVKVTPGVGIGLATIYDTDLLIWAASQINEAVERGLPHSRMLAVSPYDILRSIRRGTSGKDYTDLRAALRRLTATTVETNIRAKGTRRTAQFSLMESWTEEIDEATGQSRGMVITLSQWLYDGILDQSLLLSISPDYFDITSGIGRWLYRVARKHAGKQPAGWAFPMTVLHEKSGSTQRLADFAKELRRIVRRDDLPEYHVTIYEGARGDEIVHMTRRDRLDPSHPAYRLPSVPRRRVVAK